MVRQDLREAREVVHQVEDDPRVQPAIPAQLYHGLVIVLPDAELQAAPGGIEWLLVALRVVPGSEAESVGRMDEVREAIGLLVDRMRIELRDDRRARCRLGRARESSSRIRREQAQQLEGSGVHLSAARA